MSRRRWIAAAIAAALIGAVVAYRLWWQRNADAERLGAVCRATLDDGRPVLVAASAVVNHDPDTVDEESWRLVAVALDDGARLGVATLQGPKTCVPAHAGHIWCTGPGGLELRRLPALDVAADHEALSARVPALAPGVSRVPSAGFVPATGHLAVQAADGRRWSIDSRALTAEPLDELPRDRLPLNPSGLHHDVTEVKIDEETYRFEETDGARKRLVGAGPGDTYLRPDFLEDSDHFEVRPLVVAGHLVFLHATSLDAARAERIVTGWGPGQRAWSITGPNVDAVAAFGIEDRVVIVWGEPRVEVVAIDANTGAVPWTRRL